MVWLSRITEHSTFAGGMLGPELLLGASLGPLFVLIFLVGLAVIGTVAWSAVASSPRSLAAAAARAGVHATDARPPRCRPRCTTTRWRPGLPGLPGWRCPARR